jgi:hypothetical protein
MAVDVWAQIRRAIEALPAAPRKATLRLCPPRPRPETPERGGNRRPSSLSDLSLGRNILPQIWHITYEHCR